jgi:Arc/MetJ-type ribon-helix-helix transcriptional regulator
MDVVLTKELEKVVEQQVKSGLYHDADEVIRNAIRQTYCSVESDSYLDSDEVAEKVLQARQGKYFQHEPRTYDRILEKVISKKK